MSVARLTIAISFLFINFPIFAQVSATACGPLANNYGPFDYRGDKYSSNGYDTHQHRLLLVEGAHFTPRVESLVGGKSSSTGPGADLDYTLRAIPNHHRALLSVMRYGALKGTPKPEGLRYVVECYFERAIRFRSDDAITRILYSIYLTNSKRIPEAIGQLEQATVLAGENAFTHYNIGLTYFDMKIFDRALAQAHRAEKLGIERTQLQDLLQAAGQWREPTVTPPIDK